MSAIRAEHLAVAAITIIIISSSSSINVVVATTLVLPSLTSLQPTVTEVVKLCSKSMSFHVKSITVHGCHY